MKINNNQKLIKFQEEPSFEGILKLKQKFKTFNENEFKALKLSYINSSPQKKSVLQKSPLKKQSLKRIPTFIQEQNKMVLSNVKPLQIFIQDNDKNNLTNNVKKVDLKEDIKNRFFGGRLNKVQDFFELKLFNQKAGYDKDIVAIQWQKKETKQVLATAVLNKKSDECQKFWSEIKDFQKGYTNYKQNGYQYHLGNKFPFQFLSPQQIYEKQLSCNLEIQNTDSVQFDIQKSFDYTQSFKNSQNIEKQQKKQKTDEFLRSSLFDLKLKEKDSMIFRSPKIRIQSPEIFNKSDVCSINNTDERNYTFAENKQKIVRQKKLKNSSSQNTTNFQSTRISKNGLQLQNQNDSQFILNKSPKRCLSTKQLNSLQQLVNHTQNPDFFHKKSHNTTQKNSMANLFINKNNNNQQLNENYPVFLATSTPKTSYAKKIFQKTTVQNQEQIQPSLTFSKKKDQENKNKMQDTKVNKSYQFFKNDKKHKQKLNDIMKKTIDLSLEHLKVGLNLKHILNSQKNSSQAEIESDALNINSNTQTLLSDNLSNKIKELNQTISQSKQNRNLNKCFDRAVKLSNMNSMQSDNKLIQKIDLSKLNSQNNLNILNSNTFGSARNSFNDQAVIQEQDQIYQNLQFKQIQIETFKKSNQQANSLYNKNRNLNIKNFPGQKSLVQKQRRNILQTQSNSLQSSILNGTKLKDNNKIFQTIDYLLK